MAQRLSGKGAERAPALVPLWRAYAAIAASGLRACAQAIARFVRTVWRLAEALDSALWRGFKLSLRATGGFILSTLTTARDALADVFRWLPSRGGRAYAAASSIVLAISALWIVDEIRNAGVDDRAGDPIFRPPVDLNDPVVARIDGRFVHLSEIEAAARAADQIRSDEELTLDAAFDRKLVEAYVEQRLLARAAANEGLHRDPAVLRRLNAARDRILASSYMESRIEAAVTPERVKRLYDSQVDVTRLGDEVKARHILVASEAEALSILAEIRAGGDFAALARARSLDRATAPLGGEIGWFTKDMMAPDFAAVAFATPRGAISEPFASEFGWHILEVEDRRPAQGVSFAAVEDNIKRFLTMRTVSQTIDELKTDENVLYFPPEASSRE